MQAEQVCLAHRQEFQEALVLQMDMSLAMGLVVYVLANLDTQELIVVRLVVSAIEYALSM